MFIVQTLRLCNMGGEHAKTILTVTHGWNELRSTNGWINW